MERGRGREKGVGFKLLTCFYSAHPLLEKATSSGQTRRKGKKATQPAEPDTPAVSQRGTGELDEAASGSSFTPANEMLASPGDTDKAASAPPHGKAPPGGKLKEKSSTS